MPRPRKAPLELTFQERLYLGKYRLNVLSKYAALRADIVLRASRGQSNYEIAKQLGVSKNTVRHWRARFEKMRMKGLETRPIPGRPRKNVALPGRTASLNSGLSQGRIDA